MTVTYTGITRTTSSPIYTDFNVTSFLAECNALKALLVPGAILDHDLLRRLQVVYNNFETHRHTATDQYFSAYTGSGNLGGTDSSGVITTTDPVGFTASTIAVLSGTLVTAALVNDFVAKINASKTHFHNVTESATDSGTAVVNNPPPPPTPIQDITPTVMYYTNIFGGAWEPGNWHNTDAATIANMVFNNPTSLSNGSNYHIKGTTGIDWGTFKYWVGKSYSSATSFSQVVILGNKMPPDYGGAIGLGWSQYSPDGSGPFYGGNGGDGTTPIEITVYGSDSAPDPNTMLPTGTQISTISVDANHTPSVTLPCSGSYHYWWINVVMYSGGNAETGISSIQFL